MFSITKESEEGERNIELSSDDDETKKILRSSSAVIEDENGKTVGMVTVLSDITKQKELEGRHAADGQNTALGTSSTGAINRINKRAGNGRYSDVCQ